MPFGELERRPSIEVRNVVKTHRTVQPRRKRPVIHASRKAGVKPPPHTARPTASSIIRTGDARTNASARRSRHSRKRYRAFQIARRSSKPSRRCITPRGLTRNGFTRSISPRNGTDRLRAARSSGACGAARRDRGSRPSKRESCISASRALGRTDRHYRDASR